MQIKDPEIFALIERIGDHYRTNIDNRFIRVALNGLTLDPGTRDQIEALTEKSDNYRYQGYHLDELYQQIIAVARFIYQTRRQVLPNIRAYSSYDSRNTAREGEKILRDMAFANLAPNLKILADQVNELYLKTVAFDRNDSGEESAVYLKIPELGELGRYLVE